MSDTKDADNSGRRQLTLGRKTDTGTVKQSFSHGRSKQVLVETKKKRVVVAPTPAAPNCPAATGAPAPAGDEARAPGGLSQAELRARQAALELRRREDEKRRAEQAAIEESNRRRAEEAKRIAEEEQRRAQANVAEAAPPAVEAEDDGFARRGGRDAGPAPGRSEGGRDFRPRDAGRPPRLDEPRPARQGERRFARPGASGPGAPRPGGGGAGPRPGGPGGPRPGGGDRPFGDRPQGERTFDRGARPPGTVVRVPAAPGCGLRADRSSR